MNKLPPYFSLLAITCVLCVSLTSAQQMDEHQVLPVEIIPLPVEPQIYDPSDLGVLDDAGKQIGDPLTGFDDLSDDAVHQIREPVGQIDDPVDQIDDPDAPVTEPKVLDPENCGFFPIRQPGEKEGSFIARVEAYKRHCKPKTQPDG